jgi:hypothetical protein
LPDLTFSAERDIGTREAIDPQDRARYGVYSLDELRLQGRATWRLDRLIFDPEELRASREAVRLSGLRQEIALTAVRLFFERRRLELDLEEGRRLDNAKELRMVEITATLDALCGTKSPNGDPGASGDDTQ